MQQGLHRPVLRHRHGDPRRAEAGLAHPAGHHGAAEAALALAAHGGEHAERSHHPAQGLDRRFAAALLQATGGAALAAALLGLQLAAQGGARLLERLDAGGIGAELHLDGLEGEAEAPIAQLALQQIEGLPAPAEAAEHAHGLAAVALGQHRAQGRHDRCGRMAAEGGRADQQGIAAADRLDQLLGRGELAIEALHPHAGARHATGQGIGDGGGVAVGAGVQERHRQARAVLALAPAAVVGHQAAPAACDRRPMERRDRADRQVVQLVEHHLHLAGHRRHQAVVEPAAVLLGAAAVGLVVGLGADVGREELAAHQQAGALLKRHQRPRPAGGGRGDQAEAETTGQAAADVLLDDIDGGQGRQGGRLRRPGLGRPALLPQLTHQLGAGIGGHQRQLRPALGQGPQQLHPVGVDHAHHHLEGGIRRHALGQGGEEGLGVGHAGRMDQHRRHRMTIRRRAALEQEAVGGGAPLQAVLHLEAQPPRAQAPQTDETRFDRQGDDAAAGRLGRPSGGRGRVLEGGRRMERRHGGSRRGENPGAARATSVGVRQQRTVSVGGPSAADHGSAISNGCPPCGGARRCGRWRRQRCPAPPRHRRSSGPAPPCAG